jgi:hypothetical protein
MYDDGSVMYFTENGSYLYGEKYNLIEVWEPQEGEWCWNDYSLCVSSHVSMYSGMNGVFFESADGLSWDNCAKYTEKLPEHLKGK